MLVVTISGERRKAPLLVTYDDDSAEKVDRKNLIGLSENANIHKILSIKYGNKRKYKNWNTSVLPLNELNIYLDADFKRLFCLTTNS